MGVDPAPLTLRELFLMYEGRDRQSWLYVATMEANAAIIGGNQDVTPHGLHPYMQQMRAPKAIAQKLKEINERNKRQHEGR